MLTALKQIKQAAVTGSFYGIGKAIANTTDRATEKRIRELPITPDKLL